MFLCSALSLPRKKNTKTFLIETKDNPTDIQVKENQNNFVKLRQGSGKEGQGMALKAKGLKA